MTGTSVEATARAMTKRERAAFLKAHGWTRLSADGSQSWLDPDEHGHWTLAAAIRAAIEADRSPHGCSAWIASAHLVSAANREEGHAPIVCDGCHATAGRLADRGHFGTCRGEGRHQHHQATPIKDCSFWREFIGEAA